MGKTEGKSSSSGGGKGWKGNSVDGKLLKKLLRKKVITLSMGPGAVKEKWPQFRKYDKNAFSSALRREKKNAGMVKPRAKGEFPVSRPRTRSTDVQAEQLTLPSSRLSLHR